MYTLVVSLPVPLQQWVWSRELIVSFLPFKILIFVCWCVFCYCIVVVFSRGMAGGHERGRVALSDLYVCGSWTSMGEHMAKNSQ